MWGACKSKHKFDQMDTRLRTLGETHETRTEPELDPHPHVPCLEPRRAQHHDPVLEFNQRRPNLNFVNQDEGAIRNIKQEAPTFSGCLDPKVYLDWKRHMDQYFPTLQNYTKSLA